MRQTWPEGAIPLDYAPRGPLACSTFPPVRGAFTGDILRLPLQSSDPCLRIRDTDILAGPGVYLQHLGAQESGLEDGGRPGQKASAPVSTPGF